MTLSVRISRGQSFTNTEFIFGILQILLLDFRCESKGILIHNAVLKELRVQQLAGISCKINL